MSRGHSNPVSTPVKAPVTDGLAHPPGAGRRQRRAAETRLRLFRCALQLFAERGFSCVTVEDITEAADVGKGTFFNYFESKDHVLGVMAEVQLGKVREALTAAEQGRRTIHSVLHRLMLRLAEEPGRSPSLARAFISSFLASEGVRTAIARNMREGRRMIAQLVAAGQERREIHPRLRKKELARQLLQTCMGTVLLWSLDGTPALKARIEDSFQHFWRAIAVSGEEQRI
ncbi:MAG: TetR/AcrR family transcriptional regulator [Terracidiphilus sp.]